MDFNGVEARESTFDAGCTTTKRDVSVIKR